MKMVGEGSGRGVLILMGVHHGLECFREPFGEIVEQLARGYRAMFSDLQIDLGREF